MQEDGTAEGARPEVGEVVPTLRPTFTLTIGSLSSGTDNPVAGPGSLVVERDMDVPADALRLRLRERAGIAVGDEVSLSAGARRRGGDRVHGRGRDGTAGHL